ncbi:U11/U12 small nuclear ribonucleoprotein 35 kDa protein isoform X1 [Carcharodon carcharias]|uniref:U11/U12 small nuclear ribonucleoprotein 35 kDa protein isoform X1 n=2 Tax=Carcharodon carcharias TaxID=13397 RepID=UPI001B7E5ED0|nr:U11/U12 small nuclear ribonucleoprotein 35 kDa protein isoform X1 [Carcharodon carcharias]
MACVQRVMNELWTPIAKHYNPLKAGSIDGTDEEPHDRAVSRAIAAKYRPNKGVLGDPHLTLFVARLNPQTSEEKLKDTFSRFGDIRRLRLVRDIVTGFSKCYGFIEYKDERSLLKAHRDSNKLVVDQNEIFVDFELERTLKGWVPRRLGGGLGGKKESGQLRFGGRDRPFRKPISLPALKAELYTEGQADKLDRSSSRELSRDSWQWERGRDWERQREREERGKEREKRERDRERYRSRERDHKRQRDEDRCKQEDRHQRRNRHKTRR